jgi:hypothetical protein
MKLVAQLLSLIRRASSSQLPINPLIPTTSKGLHLHSISRILRPNATILQIHERAPFEAFASDFEILSIRFPKEGTLRCSHYPEVVAVYSMNIILNDSGSMQKKRVADEEMERVI